MSTAIGYKMAGGSVRYFPTKLISAAGYKITGAGKRKAPGRPRKVGRPKKK